MKRNGLRALGLASCVVALFSILGLAVDVSGIASNELIEEISKAAGLNLVDQYIADYTVEELTDLAARGLTPGIQLAADRALFKINGGLISLIELTDEELLAMAAAGDLDAADAYVFNHKAGLKKPAAVEEAIAAATDDALITAYGKLLGGFYGPGSPVGMKTEAELLVLVKGEDLGLRVAAATALTTYWILGSDLTIAQVESAILGVTLVHPELAAAYQGFLTYLYSL
jgi:hypothetical protein